MAEEHDPNERITEFKPIDADQLAYAQELLEELHPLEDTPLCKVYPLLGCFTACGLPEYPKKRSKTDENHSLDNEHADPLLSKKKTMLVNGKEVQKKKKKKKKNNVNPEHFKEDPIGALGFGIVAYRDILQTLIWVFALFTALIWPTKMIYESGTGYDGLNDAYVQYERSSIGNLGYSSVQCSSIPVEVGTLTLSCPYGTIGAVYDFGVNFGDASASNCANNDAVKACKPDSPDVPKVLDLITSGQKTYSIKYGSASAFYLSDVGKEDCKTPTSRFFVQYTCVQSEDELATKYGQLCLAVSSAILISFLFLIMVRYLYQGGKLKQIDWDMSTVTAGDYTVEFPIKKENYIDWKKFHYDNEGGYKEQGVSPAIGLKMFLTSQIEEILDTYVRENPDVINEKMTEKQKKKLAKKRAKAEKKGEPLPDITLTKVADIQFSFNNAELIIGLRNRGKKIAYNDFEGMRAEEAKIQTLFDDPEEYQNLTIPTAAFITFESDDSKVYALNNTSDQQLMYQDFRFESASEPTDIIWENRFRSQNQIYCREALACFMISIVLAISFLIVFQISTYSAKIAAVFPTNDCDVVAGNYENEALFEKYAIDDANFIKEHLGAQSFGVLQCFCSEQSENDPENYQTVEYDMDGAGNMQPMCGNYQEQVDTVYYWQSALSYILIGFNYIMQVCCVALVDWIGYRTETLRLQKTTTATFSLQFFNSALLILLVNANLSEQVISFGLNNGAMGDFNQAWFRVVGNVMIGAMMFNIYYPLIEAIGYWALRFQSRLRDRSCRCCYSKNSPTKATSVQQYLDLYNGPLYYMHYKYASIMTTTFITFIYGFGIPILFPVAALCFFVLYLVEKWLLFYGYRMPPMYDERLSQDVLSKLQAAPLLFIAFGYWMASSMQILSNDHLAQMQDSQDLFITGHTYGTIFGNGGWEGLKWPMLMTFIIHLLIFFFGTYLEKLLALCCKNLIVGDIDLNEDITNYWKALDESDRNWSLKEEENARYLLTDRILTDEQYDRLTESVQTKGKTLQGTHSYDILANPLYLDDFQYVTAAEENRANCIIDDDYNEENDCAQSDLVRVILNLAYLTETEAKQFKFTPEGLKGCNAKPTTSGYTNPMM